MKSKKRKHFGHPTTPQPICFGVVLLAIAVLTGCGDTAAKGEPQQGGQALPVKVQVTRSVPINDTTEYVATLKSRDSAVIMPQVDGQITAIFVHSGTRVAPGTALMQIDPAKQQASVSTQESTLAAKRAEVEFDKQQYTRANGLYSSGVSSKQELDQAKAALDSAQSQLRRPGSPGPAGNRAAALLPGDGPDLRGSRGHPGARGRPGLHLHGPHHRG